MAITAAYGMDDKRPQTLMAPELWLVLMMVVNVMVLYLPTHLILGKIYSAAASQSKGPAEAVAVAQ